MKISKTKLKRTLNYLYKNKFWLTAIFFLSWIIFLSENNFFRLVKYNREISSLKNQENYLIQKYKQDSVRISELHTDNKSLEKFAREQYFFHLPNEEVFLIKYSQ